MKTQLVRIPYKFNRKRLEEEKFLADAEDTVLLENLHAMTKPDKVAIDQF